MKTAVLHKFVYAGLLVLAITLTSCSSQKSIESESQEGEKVLSFYNYEDGYRNHYKVSFDGDRINSIYKDGKKIPRDEIKNYEYLVYENLDEMKGKDPDKEFTIVRPRFDREKFREDMKDLQKDLRKKRKAYVFEFNDSTRKEMKKMMKDLEKNRKHIFKFNDSLFNKDVHLFKFNDSLFSKDMKDELAKLKDMKIRIHIDSDEFKKDMDMMNRELEINLNENLKDLEENIRKMTEELKEFKIDEIDIPEIDVHIPEIEIDLKDLDDDLSKLDDQMSELKVELNKLDGFMKDLRKELYKDGYIKSEDEDFSLDLREDKMSVNDKEIPSGQLGKYKDMYKKHFGKELKDNVKFRIEN